MKNDLKDEASLGLSFVFLLIFGFFFFVTVGKGVGFSVVFSNIGNRFSVCLGFCTFSIVKVSFSYVGFNWGFFS